MNVKYTERAVADIDSAIAWYEQQSKGLGLEFLTCIEEAVRRISETPTIYPVWYSAFKACLVRRFPFTVFFTEEEEAIIVHAVFDNRQDPSKRPRS